jgi:hypothetical protein
MAQIQTGHDPDEFIAYFDKICPTVDRSVRGYLIEAVASFNAGCVRSAAVMLGCASEKLLLLLCDALEGAISDGTKRATFTKDLGAKWAISHKYSTLYDRLAEFSCGTWMVPLSARVVRGTDPRERGAAGWI